MKGIGPFMQRYGVAVAFVILFIASAIWQPEYFLKPENLRNLVNQNVPVGIVAIGMTLVIIAGGIDLSVGSLMALAGALGLLVLNKQISLGASESTAVAIASLATVGVGAALGAINGIMVVAGRVAPFVATLVGLVAFRSATLALAQGAEIRSKSTDLFEELGVGGFPLPYIAGDSWFAPSSWHIAQVKISTGLDLTITWAMVLFIVLALAAGFLLNWTRFGRYAIAVGANEKAAKYSAVAVSKTKFLTYLIVGLFTGFAGLTLTTRMNSMASSTMGLYYELDAIAAVVIGGTTLRGGSGRIWGTVVGVLLLGVITNMLALASVSVYWQGVVKGAIILAAVLLQRGRE